MPKGGGKSAHWRYKKARYKTGPAAPGDQAMRKVSEKSAKKYEARQVRRIHKWQRRRPGWIARTIEFLVSPIVYLFRRLIPHSTVENILHGNLAFARRWAREGKTLRSLGVAHHSELSEAE